MNLSDIRNLTEESRAELSKTVKEVYLTRGRAGVAEYLNCRYTSAGHLMSELGLNQRELRLAKIKKDVEKPKYKNLFLSDTHLKYYLIGYIIGDGSVCKKRVTGNSYRLVISSSDKEHLDKLSNCFQGLVVKYSSRGNYTLSICDNPICKWLLSYGIKQAKSKVGMCLPDIPDEYFLRSC